MGKDVEHPHNLTIVHVHARTRTHAYARTRTHACTASNVPAEIDTRKRSSPCEALHTIKPIVFTFMCWKTFRIEHVSMFCIINDFQNTYIHARERTHTLERARTHARPGKLSESNTLVCFVSLMTPTTRACTHANARYVLVPSVALPGAS